MNEFETVAFFYKLYGDYHQYIAGASKSKPLEEKKKFCQAGIKAYTCGNEIALKHLSPTSPIRLALASNFSAFQWDIVNDYQAAITLARTTFNTAIEGLDYLTEDDYRDSVMVLSHLRDNLTLWTSNHPGEEEGPLILL